MADDARLARLAARLLRERPPAPDSRTSRDVGVSVVAQALAQRKRRRAFRAAIGVAALVAAAGAALVLAWPARAGKVAVARACAGAGCAEPGRHASDSNGHVLARGESLVAPAGQSTSVVLASGTRITLDERSAIECREDTKTQRFAMVRGRARLHVAKLHPGERFLVETPNAEVEVRGTVFSVELETPTPSCPSRTRVEVEEGAVAVRYAGGQLLLHPGERWENACAEPSTNEAAAAGVVAAPRAAAPLRTAAKTVKSTPSNLGALAPAAAPSPAAIASFPAAAQAPAPVAPDTSALPVSMLNEQNDLYARAQVAKREGRTGEALAAYARLLALFPNGQLAETAFVQRVRLLKASDPGRARAEAKRYVDHFPSGFAVAEMEGLAQSP